MLKLELKQIVGSVWNEEGKSEIVQIIISHEENKINSLQFVYVENGDLHHSEIHGKTDGLKYNAVTFDYPSEFLTSVSGMYANNRLIAIAFGTNKFMYGPFGKTNVGDAPEFILDKYSTKFNYEFGPRSCFGGFHGITHVSCVYAIGIYINPLKSLAELKPIEPPNAPNHIKPPDEPKHIESPKAPNPIEPLDEPKPIESPADAPNPIEPLDKPKPIESPEAPNPIESLAELNIK